MTFRLNVLASWIAHAVILLTGLILTPYILKTAGEHTYGGWIVLVAIAGYSRLLYLGFGETICHYVAKHAADEDWDQLNRVASCTSAVYLASATVAFLAGCLIAWLAPGIEKFAGSPLPLRDIQIAMVLLGLNAAVSIAGSVFGGLLMGLQRFDLERGVQIAITATRLVLTVAFLRADHGLIVLAAVFLFVSTMEVVLMWVFARRLLPGLRIRPSLIDRRTMRETTGFSLFTSTAVVSEQLVYATDSIVIGFRLGLLAVVPYSIAHRLCEMMRQPIHQVGIVSLPRASELHRNRQTEQLTQLVLGSMGLSVLLAGASLVGGWSFGAMLVRIWMPPDYRSVAETHNLMLLLVAAQIIALPVGILRKSLVGAGFVKLPSLLVFAGAIANLVVSLLLVGPYGVYGVAYGTLIPIVLIDGLLLLPIGLKHLGISRRRAILELGLKNLPPLVVLALYCELVKRLDVPENWLSIGLIAGCGAAVTMAVRFGPAVVTNPRQVLRGGLES